MTEQTQSRPFTGWPELLDAISAGYRIYYRAPLDYRRALVSATVRKDGSLWVVAPWGEVDPFIADAGHLPRFSRLSGAWAQYQTHEGV